LKYKLKEIIMDIIEKDDPYISIWNYLFDLGCQTYKDANSITDFYEKYEAQVSTFEKWLYLSWGNEIYELLIEKTKLKSNLSIIKALKKAKQLNANVLISDGFSLREAIIIANKLKDKLKDQRKIIIELGYAYPPTITSKALEIQLGKHSFNEIIDEGSIPYINNLWSVRYIEPSKIGGTIKANNTIFITYLPDIIFHEAVIKRGRRRKAISEDVIVNQLSNVIYKLSDLQPLVVTGDHGYLYLGVSPYEYMWESPVESPRYGDIVNDGRCYITQIDNIAVVSGRYHLPSTDKLITHGGISLMESLVPLLIIH